GHERAASFSEAAWATSLARARLRRRVLREQELVRRYVSSDRPGSDHRDDREPSVGPLVETVHGGARSARRTAATRVLEPAPRRSGAVTESLEQWLGREHAHAATAMLRSVSARELVKERPG